MTSAAANNPIDVMNAMLEATARAEDRHFWFRGLRRSAKIMLDAALNGRRLHRIVDCGSGTGRNLDWLRDYGAAVGVERSPSGLAVALAHGRPVVQGSVDALPIASASADLATSFDVLYCLPDAVEPVALAEMMRVLRPGGVALFNVAALDVLHGSHSTLTMELRRYTRARLRTRLEAAGFVVERMTFTNCSTFPMTLAVRVFDRWSGRVAKASDADLQLPAAPINAVLDLALSAEAQLMRYVNLPIGTSLMCVARKA
ncbi:MAG: class I SAM-dependent methyltransferase [Vicinamibacterales bacterium]